MASRDRIKLSWWVNVLMVICLYRVMIAADENEVLEGIPLERGEVINNLELMNGENIQLHIPDLHALEDFREYHPDPVATEKPETDHPDQPEPDHHVKPNDVVRLDQSSPAQLQIIEQQLQQSSSEKQCATQETHRQELLARIERLETLLNATTQDSLEQDQSLLDIWLTQLQHTIQHDIIPPTDKECTFDWATRSCKPNCRCNLQYRLGDYSLNRACRLTSDTDKNCLEVPSQSKDIENKANGAVENTIIQETAYNMLSNMVIHVRNFTSVLLSPVKTFLVDIYSVVLKTLQEHAPESDDICYWSFKKMKCTPAKYCKFNYQWGDYSLSRACRLRAEEDNY